MNNWGGRTGRRVPGREVDSRGVIVVDAQAARPEPGINREEPIRAYSARGRGVNLVLGGTGMLLPAVRQLLREGKELVVAGRRDGPG